MRLFLLVHFTVLISTSVSYKFLVYNPFLWPSHVKFLANIADVLTEGGHDVTVLMPEMNKDLVNVTGLRSTKRIVRSPGDPRVLKKEQESKQDSFRSIWTTSSSAVAMLQITKKMSEIFKWQCETLINDDALLQRLKEEKFDVGIAEPNTVCALGLFEVLDIKSTIAVVSNPHLESVAFAIGEPFLPSYIPGLFSSTGDKMTFLERLENIFALTVAKIFGSYCYNAEMEVFIKKFGSFKDYNELIAQVSFVFTNGNPYLDFPRPTLHKTVMIGGFAVAQREKEKQQLSQKWNSILNVSKRTVLVSFGSYARSVDMPEDFKRAMLDVFASMPDVTFIWKYEDENSNIADSIPNVYRSSWVPQVELLEDERLSLFLTHGGLASTNEVAFMGKPAIVAPILGDQMRNSRMLARHGGALVFDKSNLNDAKKLKDAFDEVLNNPDYAKNAKRLSQMLRSQPISAQELLLKHAEFAARYGRLPNLDSYGRHLSTVQYYSLDVFAAVATSLTLVVVVLLILMRKCCKRVLLSKQKKD